MGMVEVHAKHLRTMGYHAMTEVVIDEEDMQPLIDELCDAKNSLVQHNGYMPRQWVMGTLPRIPGHPLEDSPDLPNLDPEGRYRENLEMRHACRKAAI